jgi:hypothetical protein
MVVEPVARAVHRHGRQQQGAAQTFIDAWPRIPQG